MNTRGHEVLQHQFQDVEMRDGTRVRLHEVRHHGCVSSRLRAVRQGSAWVVFDLWRLDTELGIYMNRLDPVDWPGLVYYTLRLGYQGAADVHQCMARAVESRTAWVADESSFLTAAA